MSPLSSVRSVARRRLLQAAAVTTPFALSMPRVLASNRLAMPDDLGAPPICKALLGLDADR